jgi:hypothetical protein
VSIVLTREEIAEITARVRLSAQMRQLEHLGIPYRVRSDGSLLVLRIHVNVFEPPAEAPQRRAPRLRFDA